MTDLRLPGITCMTIVGARPQLIKAAALSRALGDRDIRELIVHTGQHYDHAMSQVFFEELGIKEPAYNLGIGSLAQGAQTGRMMEKIEEILLLDRPDVVLVYGDTNSTLAGALAAAKLRIPVAHVEAGLRSFNRAMPEEINRVMTDHLSDLLFCPTNTAVRNLRKEGFSTVAARGKLTGQLRKASAAAWQFPLVINVGDVMYDSLLHNRNLSQGKSDLLDRLGLTKKGYYLATIHRAENTDNPLRLQAIFRAFSVISQKHPVVIPLHPRTRKLLGDERHGRRVLLIDPVAHLDMLMLTDNARVVLTDSGGLQKEAFCLNVPCVTIRDETEWVETLPSGMNVLAGAEEASIVGSTTRQDTLPQKSVGDTPFGDGNAAARIADILVHFFSRSRPKFGS